MDLPQSEEAGFCGHKYIQISNIKVFIQKFIVCILNVSNGKWPIWKCTIYFLNT